MSNNQRNVTEYLIPANISARYEFFEGFGWRELFIVALAALVGMSFYYVLGLPQKTEYVYIDEAELMEIDEDIHIVTVDNQYYIEEKAPVVSMFTRLLVVIIPTVSAFFLCMKDPSNGMSILYILKALREFNAKQKLYLYKYNSGSEA